ncbi:MAG: phosphate/phosphite/phosphonate ABC transporter substrate-binding protein [Methylohalobius sp.]|nr:phosphate/phosphite/phosphonate ABC transporter substrate-binding protein [Methylohalobius sp.]
MTYIFTVSPDFSPEYLSGWFVFNTWLQKALDCRFHLELMEDFQRLHRAIAADKIDLIYANPYDAALLVREKGFTALAKPQGIADEVVIAVAANSMAMAVEDLPPGVRVASTDDPDVHLIGMILLEPAGLHKENVRLEIAGNYVLVAKKLLQGECEVGIFLARAFDELSRPVRSQLKVLVRSDIQVIHHALMAGPRLIDKIDALTSALVKLAQEPKGQALLAQLGFTGWGKVAPEEVEFMIDLMDTLAYSPAA